MSTEQVSNHKNRNITLRDIADDLGISKATVSLAINNNPLVAKQTRDRVLRKIKEIGYVYNRGAAGLSTGVTGTIGLAVHDITNPYFAEVCAAIESVLSKTGRMSFLCNTNDSIERQERFLNTLIEHQADGLILCAAAGTDINSLQPLVSRGLPTVLLTRNVEGAELDFVGNDEILALKLVTEHLIKLGHRRIAMLGGGQQTSTSYQRRAGYRTTMEENSLPIDESYFIDCDTNPKSGEKAVKRALKHKNHPTAFVCYTDQLALGAISGIYEMGLKPGKDIAIVGCDDIEEAGRAYVQLTTAKIKKWSIGKIAADTLIRRITNRNLQFQRIHFKPELVVRKSCGAII